MYRIRQYCCDIEKNILRYQKAKVIDEAIKAKDGKIETEEIGEPHE